MEEVRRILVIDDDASVRGNIAAYLEDSGFCIMEAPDGRQGLDSFVQHPPDLVLLDLWMPVMDGFDFLRHTRAISERIPVIVVSGMGSLEDAVETLRQGAWDYVTKPIVDMRVLEHAITKCLERAELLLERDRYQQRLESEVRESTQELIQSNSHLREYQNLLLEKTQFLQALLESIPSPVFYKDLQGRYIGGNELFKGFASLPPGEDLGGKEAEELFPEAVVLALSTGRETEIKASGVASYEIVLPRDGKERHVEVYQSYFHDRNGQVTGVVGTLHDITELKEKEARILHQATHDDLTGLLNRWGILSRLAEVIRKNDANTRYIVFYLDIEDFKTVNDSLGHAVGDMLIAQVGERLSLLFDVSCALGRVGGDEFLLMLPIGNDPSEPKRMGEQLVGAFEKPFFAVNHEVFIQPCVGYCIFPDDAADPDGLLRNADLAMYRTRDLGRRVGRFDTAMVAEATRRLELGKMLRKGMENDEFILMYQPKVGVKGVRTVGMEALIRWTTPSGRVLPSEFIPVAEDTGLIVELGEWVLREACFAQRRFAAHGIEDLVMAVNISARQLQSNLPSLVAQVLEETGVPPQYLELEITESTVMRDMEAAMAILRELRAMGLRIAIDDFGTGHSSLFYLKNLPIDTLKIDKGFVQDVCNDMNDAILVSAIVSMARSLGLDLVAEGVETAAQMAFLRNAGCAQVQGYYFSKPLDEAAFLQYIMAERNLERDY